MNINFSDSAKLFKLIYRIGRLVELNELTGKNISSAFSEGQIMSKNWLVDACVMHQLNLKIVFLCGGWYATLFLDERLSYDKVRSFDIDPMCERIADEINRDLVQDDWRFKAATEDIHSINYLRHTYNVRRKDGSLCELTDSPDTVINTSCEHIQNFASWYGLLPKDTLLILQSNNGMGIEGHINCSADLSSFEQSTPMSQVIYSGEKAMPQFNRYMRIGYK